MKVLYGLAIGEPRSASSAISGRDSYAQPIFNRGNSTQEAANASDQGFDDTLSAVTAANYVIVVPALLLHRFIEAVATSGIVNDVLISEGTIVSAGTPLLQF